MCHPADRMHVSFEKILEGIHHDVSEPTSRGILIGLHTYGFTIRVSHLGFHNEGFTPWVSHTSRLCKLGVFL